MSTEATITETRAAKIESYAVKAADLTRKVFTQGYSAADSIKSFLATPKASTVAALDKAKVASKDLLARAKAKAKSATGKNGVSAEPPAAAA